MNQISGIKAAGTLDPSFGVEGTVSLPNGTRSIVVLPNKKVVALTDNRPEKMNTLTRLTEMGELDPSFGDNGVVELPKETDRIFPEQIIALKNGGYLLLGYQPGTQSRVKYVCRLLENGQLDTTFGIRGIGEIYLPSDATFVIGASMAVSELSGEIYLCTSVYSVSNGFLGAIFRLSKDGFLDLGFGSGIVFIQLDGAPYFYIALRSLAVYGDGVLIGGEFLSESRDRGVAFLKRYNQDGRLDSSFGEGGTVVIPKDAAGADSRTTISSVVVRDDDGLIVMTGALHKGSEVEGLLAVLNSNGGFNLVFNGGKPLYATFLPGLVFSTGVLQQGTKIIVTGYDEAGRVMAARYEFNGSLDSTFGSKGWVIFKEMEGGEFVRSSELTPDNKVVVLGQERNELRVFAIRYLG